MASCCVFVSRAFAPSVCSLRPMVVGVTRPKNDTLLRALLRATHAVYAGLDHAPGRTLSAGVQPDARAGR